MLTGGVNWMSHLFLTKHLSLLLATGFMALYLETCCVDDELFDLTLNLYQHLSGLSLNTIFN